MTFKTAAQYVKKKKVQVSPHGCLINVKQNKIKLIK